MKSLFKIYIHPFTYIVIFISFITGHFKELVCFLSIILIHELGHIIVSLIFKWKMDKLSIMPFGCVTYFNEIINKSSKEEFFILIAGPLFQFIYFLIFKDITNYFNYYNYGLFIFNMLPIYPLDGYKLMVIIFNRFIPYKKTLYISIYISLILLVVFFKKDLLYIIILLLLLKGVIKEYKNINLIYHKFLLERFLYKFHFRKYKKVKNINNLYKDYNNLILDNKKYMTEKEYLNIRYMG